MVARRGYPAVRSFRSRAKPCCLQLCMRHPAPHPPAACCGATQAMLAEPSITPACASAVYSAARLAPVLAQQPLLRAAASSIQRLAENAAAGGAVRQHSVWGLQLAASSAAVAALRPAAYASLGAAQSGELVLRLVQLALSSADVAAARLAALAAAATVNKWQAGERTGLRRCPC